MRNVLKAPSQEQVDCQHPKPILLDTGEMKIPYEWAVGIQFTLHLIYVVKKPQRIIDFVHSAYTSSHIHME